MSRKPRNCKALALACGSVAAFGIASQVHAQVIPLFFTYNDAESGTEVTNIDPLSPSTAYLPTQFFDTNMTSNGLPGSSDQNQFYQREGPSGTNDTEANWNSSSFMQFNFIVPPNNGSTDPSYIPDGPQNFQLVFGGDVLGETTVSGNIPLPTNAPGTAITMNLPLAPYQPVVNGSSTGYFYMIFTTSYGYNGAYSATDGFPEPGSAAAGGPAGGPADGLTYYVGATQLNSTIVRGSSTDLLYATQINGQGNVSWASPTTWYNGATPSIAGDVANLGNSSLGTETITMDAAETIGALNFGSSNSYTLASGNKGTLTLSGFAGGAATVSVPTSSTLTLNDVISAPVTLAGPTSVSLGGGFELAITGNVSGPGSITISGTPTATTGSLLLSGNNSFTGGTTVNDTVQLGSSTALGTGPLTVNFNATVDLNGNSASVGGLSGSGVIDNVSAGGNVTFTDNGQGDDFFGGQINESTGTVNFTYNGGPGLLILGGANGYTGLTTIQSGSLIIQNAAALPTGGNVVNNGSLVIQAGSIALSNPVVLGNISGTAGFVTIGGPVDGYVQLNAGSGPHTQAFLSVANGSTLDVTNNRIVLNFGANTTDPMVAIAAALATGYNSGTWDGVGIDGTAAAIQSSTAAGDPSKFAVGYLDGRVAGDTAGGHVAVNQGIVAYTLAGDAFLQGSVGFNDLVVVAENFGKTGEDWAGGNFNYNAEGSVGFADLVSVAENFGDTTNPVLTGSGGGGLSPAWLSVHTIAVVPEPASIGMAVLAGAGLLARRRRGKAM